MKKVLLAGAVRPRQGALYCALLTFIIACSYILSAQGNGSKKVRYDVLKALDTALVEFRYRYICTDHMQHSSEAVLQVGKRMTKFQAIGEYFSDSLMVVHGGKYYTWDEVDKIESVLPRRGYYPGWHLIDNYPKGKTTIIEYVSFDFYSSEEERALPQWTIMSDSVRQVMGYTCQMARTELHGRRWTAWFAPSVKLPYGPWLLRGLPGLVVWAYDDDKEFDMLLLGKTNRKSIIGIEDRVYIRAPRESVLKIRRRFMEEAPGIVKRMTGVKVDGDIKPIKRRYNPIRRIKTP